MRVTVALARASGAAQASRPTSPRRQRQRHGEARGGAGAHLDAAALYRGADAGGEGKSSRRGEGAAPAEMRPRREPGGDQSGALAPG